jgi:hypothetical protein
MAHRLQDDDAFPRDVRDLASEANLPVPSWHIGRIYEDDDGGADGATTNGGGQEAAHGSQHASSAPARSVQGSRLTNFLGALRLPRLTWHRR